MARYASFGEALREARIRKGIEPHVAAKRLRIRTDILQAIEEADFAYLPAKGYCKSMISAYARMVGLNSEEIVSQYLEEAYSFEVGRVRESSRYEPRSVRENLGGASSRSSSRSRHVESQVSRGGRIRVHDDRASRYRVGEPARYDQTRRSRANAEVIEDRRSSSSRRLGDSREMGNSRTSRNNARPQGGRGTVGFPALPLPSLPSGGRSAQGSGRPRQSRSALPTSSTHYSNMVASPSRGGQASKLPFFAAGFVLLLVLVLIAVLVFGDRSENSSEDLPDVPISGLTDTSTPVDPEADPSVPTPPSSAEFGYKVPEGQSAYIEVYVNGADRPSEAATVEGSTSKRYEVTGTLKFVTTNPDGVSITVDGETVKPTDEDGNGVYTYTVDFASILAAWNEANQPEPEPEPEADAGSDEGGADAAGTSEGA